MGEEGENMKAVMISIRPEWCEKIASGEKTVEVRKTRPKIEPPFNAYIYCTKVKFNPHEHLRNNLHYDDSTIKVCEGQGKVIGEFVCDEIFPIRVFENGSIQDYMCHSMERSLVPYDDISAYIGKNKTGYGWHISDLVIYEKPKELSEFIGLRKTKFGYAQTVAKPPQSWCYVEEVTT